VVEAGLVIGLSDGALALIQESVRRSEVRQGEGEVMAVRHPISRGLPVSPSTDFSSRQIPHCSRFHCDGAIGYLVVEVRGHSDSRIDGRDVGDRVLPDLSEFAGTAPDDPLAGLLTYLRGSPTPSFDQMCFLDCIEVLTGREDRLKVKMGLLRAAYRRLSEDDTPQRGVLNHRLDKLALAEEELLAARKGRLGQALILQPSGVGPGGDGLRMEESAASMIGRAVDKASCPLVFLSAFLCLFGSRTWGGLTGPEMREFAKLTRCGVPLVELRESGLWHEAFTTTVGSMLSGLKKVYGADVRVVHVALTFGGESANCMEVARKERDVITFLSACHKYGGLVNGVHPVSLQQDHAAGNLGESPKAVVQRQLKLAPGKKMGGAIGFVGIDPRHILEPLLACDGHPTCFNCAAQAISKSLHLTARWVMFVCEKETCARAYYAGGARCGVHTP